MTKVICKYCGGVFEIDEGTANEGTCRFCGRLTTLEEAAPEVYQEIQTYKEELEQTLPAVIEAYKQTGDRTELNVLVESKYRNFPEFCELWRKFILRATGAAVEREDKELQTQLKNAARRHDKENPDEKSSLFLSVMLSNRTIGTPNDWDKLIKQTHGDEVKFAGLTELIVRYIVEKRDTALAMDIFGIFAVHGKEWSDAGSVYLRTLLSSEEVAEEVFPVPAVKGKRKSFIRKVISYCKKYLEGANGISVEETPVGSNYVKARKKQRHNALIALSAVAAVLLATGLGLYFYFDAADPDTIVFTVDKVIETTYGEPIDLTGYSVTYKTNGGTTVTKPITEKMLAGYDPEEIGTQTVYVEYMGIKSGITVRVNPATLSAPVLTQSGNYITWEYVPHAASYNVYINSSSVLTTTTTVLSYDLSSNVNYGELSVTVRANSDSEKYTNSVMSAALTVTKLQPPANLYYEDGELIWDPVVGAAIYELSVNGTPYTVTQSRFAVDFLQGDNEVTISAKSASPSVVDGVTRQTIFYYHLSPITSMTYQNNRVSWDAEELATVFSVYVDGDYWRDFNRKYFDIQDDGFAQEFGETEHTIGVVCKSSAFGAASDPASFKVAVGNHVRLEGGALQWNSLGMGATYFVSVNGESMPHSLSTPSLSLVEISWRVGVNTVSVTASLDNETIICETLEVTKLQTPSVSVVGGSWVTDGNDNNRYRVDGGAWKDELPALDTLAAGDHTVFVMRAAGDGPAIEIDSEVVEIKIRKLAPPAVSVNNEQIVASFDRDKYTLILMDYGAGGASGTRIESLGDIVTAGTHIVRAALTPLGAEEGFDYVIDSEFSSTLELVKLAAPPVHYAEGDERVTSDGGNIKFYYMQNGVERELVGGIVANLPKGAFEIYARRLPQAANELTSENTPAGQRVSIFNMDITVSISKMATSQSQFYAIFGGCEEVDSLTFSYEIKYYNAGGDYIGHTPETAEMTVNKDTAVSTSNIVTLLNYRAGAQLNAGYQQTDIYTVELVVRFSDESGGQTLTARMTV